MNEFSRPWWPARRLGVISTASLLFFADAPIATAAQGWRIDEAHTSIGFKIDAVGFPATRGHFNRYSGRIFIDLQRPAKSFTSFTVYAASVDLGSRSFDGFVKGATLLNVGRYPTLSFTSTEVNKLDANTVRVVGDLTMLGVTRPITLIVKVETDAAAKGGIIGFVATTTVARSSFGMTFGIPIIDDLLEITVQTRAVADE